MYAGHYELIDARRVNDDPINIPHQEGFYPYTLTIEEAADSSGKYTFSFKIGNSLRSTMTMSTSGDGATVSFTPIMSTKMMPPPPVFELERFASRVLEGANTIDHSNATSRLSLSGSNGILIFEKK